MQGFVKALLVAGISIVCMHVLAQDAPVAKEQFRTQLTVTIPVPKQPKETEQQKAAREAKEAVDKSLEAAAAKAALPGPRTRWVIINLAKKGKGVIALDVQTGKDKKELPLVTALLKALELQAKFTKLIGATVLPAPGSGSGPKELSQAELLDLMETAFGGTPTSEETSDGLRIKLNSKFEEVLALIEQAQNDVADQMDFTASDYADPARWVNWKGAKVRVISIAANDNGNTTGVIDVTEPERKSRIQQDMESLLKATNGGKNLLMSVRGATPQPMPQYIAFERTYTLNEWRAAVEINAKALDKSGTTDPKETASFKQVMNTGSWESFYLSLDIPVSKVKVTEDTHLDAKDKPSEFLVGFNWLIGSKTDFGNTKASPSGFVLKAFIKPSSKPLDQFGGAIGYRFGDHTFSNATLSGALSALTINAGWIWNREERLLLSGTKTNAYPGQFVLSIGFNMDKAAEWFKK
ncbi:MAG: hypothetical protein IPQ13_08020 [Holophagaceae bacterium]|nr:hypothetical protein [Holophagaceae bacterium]